MGDQICIALVSSLDVEEEGLFCGSYDTGSPGVDNIAELRRLEPLFDAGLRPTFFCSHRVFSDHMARNILAKYCERHDIEIGAHLHHWNTPPYEDGKIRGAVLKSVPTAMLDRALLAAKLESLLLAGKIFYGQDLLSFRMGRWDLRLKDLELLAGHGIICDASIRPLHCGTSHNLGPDHFHAPSDPFWLRTGSGEILEIPQTVIPLIPGMAKSIKEMGKALPAFSRFIKATLKNWGALALLPVYHPLEFMKFISRKHIARGGRVISLAWHSSELMPGGNPRIPDGDGVTRLIGKIRDYILWLAENWQLRHMHMSELANGEQCASIANSFPVFSFTGLDFYDPVP